MSLTDIKNYTTDQLKQMLDFANEGIELGVSFTAFEITAELASRRFPQRYPVSDDQEEINARKFQFDNANTEQSFI